MNHGGLLTEAAGGGRIESVEWGDVQPYVMFFTGRCGSTWLTELLAGTGVAGNPREWLNSNVARYSGALAGSLPGYFSNVVHRESPGGHFGLQVDPVRLKDTRPLVDWRAAFPVDQTATFFLYRRDLAAQAWSWVHARKSGIWHSSDRARRDEVSLDRVPTARELASEIVALRRREEYLFAFWAEHGYRPRFIEYETLVADPATTIATVLRDLGASDEEIEKGATGGVAKAERLNYDSKVLRLAEFAHQNRDALTLLGLDRFGTSADTLAESLAEVGDQSTRYVKL